MKTYEDIIKYLYGKLPMFTRSGPAAYKEGLGNISALSDYLHHPEKKYKTIHIAGTNGKGSTSHMLAAILQSAGYKTGLYTSPHLKDFTERIRVNGKTADTSFIVQFIQDHKTFIESLSASFFEVTTAMSFEYFARESVDIAVIETGLGGRLDSTNIITPDLSIITNISWDHADLLGNTLEKIAYEKAGIIKSQTPVVISEKQSDIQHIFIQKAAAEDAPIYFAQDSYEYLRGELLGLKSKHVYLRQQEEISIETDLKGSYQSKNIAGVLMACEVLNEYGYLINDEHIVRALGDVKSITGLRGRWDVLQQKPLMIADVAHNEGGLKETIEQFRKLNRPMHFVLGFVKDKDLKKVLPLFPQNAVYYFCAPDLPRALDAEALKIEASHFGLQGSNYGTVKAALDAAVQQANNEDAIYVGGSTFVVAEIL